MHLLTWQAWVAVPALTTNVGTSPRSTLVPVVPAPAPGPPAQGGCSDTDAVTLGDECPTELETPNGYLDRDGCPDEYPPDVQRMLTLHDAFRFPPVSTRNLRDSVRLSRQARAAAREIAAVLRAYPDMRIELSGHLDAEEQRAYFHRSGLGGYRTAAVRAVLIAEGIAEHHIETRSAGADEPSFAAGWGASHPPSSPRPGSSSPSGGPPAGHPAHPEM